METKNRKLPDDVFYRIRNEVLMQWPTGKEVDFDNAVDYYKKLPAGKKFSLVLEKAKQKGSTLIQPRAGVALLDEHIELLRFLESEGEADLLPTTIDSYTRLNMYKEAEEAIAESKGKSKSLLNGFPAVNYGVQACREVAGSVDLPVQVRHGTPDARLLAEITLSGGFTAFEGGGISYNIPYAKSISIENTISNWQYIDRLVGLYEECGVSINREPFGPLTGTMVPPCISHSVAILESILAAEQGVKNITVGYGQNGNLIQDVAAVRVLELLTEEYLCKHGYSDVKVTTVFHQWMGGFPQDESKAFGVISWGAATAALSGATKVIVKTPHEAFGVPTKEANAQGLKTTKQIVAMLNDQKMVLSDELMEEIEIIKEETRCIVRIVGQAGIEPFIRALELGAQVIVAGRAYDPAVFAAPAVQKGFGKGLAIHMGKILECACIAATPGSGSDCMIGYLYEEYFEVEPLNPKRRCTTLSVAAYTLYEKTDPYFLPGPGGMLDLTETRFEQITERRVRVTGSKYLPSDKYTVKLEGVKMIGYRTISIAGTRDPVMIGNIDEIISEVRKRLEDNFKHYSRKYFLDFKVYGRNGVMGKTESEKNGFGHELGIIIEAVADDQNLANTICGFARSTMLHHGYEGRISTAGNLAFPYSPSDIKMGEVYTFNIYNIIDVDDPNELFPIEIQMSLEDGCT